jgi:dTDP-4-amino-4,6-dideoxygalactose transaminase
MAANSLYDKGIPDRHIYYHWDYVMQKRSPDVHGRPWNDPDRPAQVQYTRDMCPQTLDLLGRVVVMPISQTMSDAHVQSCIQAVKKVTAAL